MELNKSLWTLNSNLASEQSELKILQDLRVINCSQTQFLAIILVLSFFSFYVIFRLTEISSDAFDFLSSKTGSTGNAQRALNALRAFQLCFGSNCFGDLCLWC